MEILKVKLSDIPLTKQDYIDIMTSSNRIDLKNSIIKNGIKYPLSVRCLNRLPEYSNKNLVRGCGRYFWAKQLGIEYADVVLFNDGDEILPKFGTEEETNL